MGLGLDNFSVLDKIKFDNRLQYAFTARPVPALSACASACASALSFLSTTTTEQ